MPRGPVVCWRPVLMWYVTFLCSIIILNESRESLVDLFRSSNCTICSWVAVRFTPHPAPPPAHGIAISLRAFVGSSVWPAHHEILYSSYQIKDAIRSSPAPTQPAPDPAPPLPMERATINDSRNPAEGSRPQLFDLDYRSLPPTMLVFTVMLRGSRFPFFEGVKRLCRWDETECAIALQ